MGRTNFKKVPDNLGMIYVPECKSGIKKNSCPDCFSCQWCGNERCHLCRGNLWNSGKKQKPEL